MGLVDAFPIAEEVESGSHAIPESVADPNGQSAGHQVNLRAGLTPRTTSTPDQVDPRHFSPFR
jgi:hypothetical protein